MSARKTPPRLAVEYRGIDSLVPYAANARTHSEAQVAQVAASIREFGFTNPVLVDPQHGIIAGHGRVLAARLLGMDQVPAITLHGLTATQRRAYVLADNKLALNAGWDVELLRSELAELKADDFELDAAGFTGLELDSLFAEEADPETEWEGMPEFNQPDARAYQSITVHLKDADAVQAFAELTGQRLTNKTRFIWYPQAEIGHYADKRYAADEP